MQLEQQQRIMGYFIEEAKDHLNTIEQGLLNLQTTLEDPELLNEVFRAAHSVKGGAAMLGLNSIQQTAHRLEDSFKILKENRLPPDLIDQQLESLFLRIFDALQNLIENLSGAYGLTDEAAQTILQGVEPVFEALSYHIKTLVKQSGVSSTDKFEPPIPPTVKPLKLVAPPVVEQPSAPREEDSAKELIFRSDVPEQLREMLQLFRQAEDSESRQALRFVCRSLVQAGEPFNLPNWIEYLETIEQAIANPANSYRILAPIVIKSIKQAQELVLANRDAEITVNETIKSLLPTNATLVTAPQTKSKVSKPERPELRDVSEAKTPSVLNPLKDLKPERPEPPETSQSDLFLELSSQTASSLFGESSAKQHIPGPELLPEEFDSLKDLFGEDDSLLQSWEKDITTETVDDGKTQQIPAPQLDQEFLDLLFDEKAKTDLSSQSGNLTSLSSSDLSDVETDLELADFFDNLTEATQAELNEYALVTEEQTPLPPVKTTRIAPAANESAQVRATPQPDELFDFDEFLNLNPSSVEQPQSGTSARVTSGDGSRQSSLDELFDQFETESVDSQEPQDSSTVTLEEGNWFEELLQTQPTPVSSSSSTSETSDEWGDWLFEESELPSPESSPSTQTELEDFDVLFSQETQNVETLIPSESKSKSVVSKTKADQQERPAPTPGAKSQTSSVLSKAKNPNPTESANPFDFDDLDALLSQAETPTKGQSLQTEPWETSDQVPTPKQNVEEGIDFDDLDALLNQAEEETTGQNRADQTQSQSPIPNPQDDDFGDLEKLLEEPKSLGGRPPVRGQSPKLQPKYEPFAKVPVKQLDNLSNLMGELVVNRNSLEQDQERMRQFLDNLLHQVSLLSDVGQRMQDFYERSLLEISLLSNRRRPIWFSSPSIPDDDHNSDMEFESTELDRFTPFHTLSQEIIELVVRVRESAADIEFLVEEADQVTRQLRQITTALQEGLTRARMEPFGSEADALKRPVRDVSIQCGKQAELFVEGRETLIDKMLLGKLRDPLIQIIKNAITHGIETPDVRMAAGKSPTGKITIKVFHQGNQTVIAISDDGAGINTEKVKSIAVKKGLISQEQARGMSSLDAYELLFVPGFSTKEVADELAGRGVGMDVVRNSLTDIRGTITTDSTPGRGTSFTIRLPLNMSISRALCCISDRARIAFPMDGVEDMIDVPREQVRVGPDSHQALEWRGSLLPFRHLRELLEYNRHLGRGNVYGTNTEEDMISVIVLRSSNNYLAVQVDQVLIEQEIVIKQLEGPVPKPIGVAGATVLGDGQIVAIADVLELIDLAMGRIRSKDSVKFWSGEAQPPVELPAKNEPTVLIVDDSITVRSLLSITFEKSGYRVEEARDGKEAWEKLKSGLPCDIVFCDIEMPRMDGLELLSRMQKDPVLVNLPIAMLTSRGADRHRQMAYQLGARGYFTKPYLEEQLLEAAQRMLRGEIVGSMVTK